VFTGTISYEDSGKHQYAEEAVVIDLSIYGELVNAGHRGSRMGLSPEETPNPLVRIADIMNSIKESLDAIAEQFKGHLA